MRRSPLIIHLHDKPHSRRSYTRAVPPSNSAGSAVLACAAIAVGVAAFFWAYDTVVHRGPPFVPAMAHEIAIGPRSAAAATKLIAPEAPAPDLHSPAVLHANADVPSEQATPPAAAEKEPDTAAPKKSKKAAVPPRKKRAHAARRLPPEAARAYASEPRFFAGGNGGF